MNKKNNTILDKLNDIYTQIMKNSKTAVMELDER